MKKAQIQITFNWLYVLIAGAVILIFFLSIVVKQKAVSDEHLAAEVIGLIDSIFTGASVAEKTKQTVETGGISDYTLNFECYEGVTDFGFKESGTRKTNSYQPIFSPKEIKTSRLLLWSFPFNFPYKVVDFLFISSSNTKYVLVGADSAFETDFINAAGGFFNIVSMPAESLEEFDPGDNHHVRIIDLNAVLHLTPISGKLEELEDSQLSMVSFVRGTVADLAVNYYKKKSDSWTHLNDRPIPIISLGGEKDAVKYAAIFAADHQQYICNMHKAFQRLNYITEIYAGGQISSGRPGGKLKEMIDYYERYPLPETREICGGYLTEYENNMKRSLRAFKNRMSSCQHELSYLQCLEMKANAEEISQINQEMRGNCITLY